MLELRRRLPEHARTAAKSAGARAIVLPFGAVATFLSTRTVFGDLGLTSFATYALVGSLAAFLPVLDTGIGPTVAEATARYTIVGNRRDTFNIIGVALRRPLFAVIMAAGFAIVLGVADVWPAILGLDVSHDASIAIGCSVALYAIAILGNWHVWARNGLGQIHISVMIQSFIPGLTLLLVFYVHLFHPTLEWYLLCPSSAAVVTAMIGCWSALRRLGGNSYLLTQSLIHGDSSFKLHAPGAMFIMSIFLPAAYYSDRIILSHLTNPGIVAAYSVAALFYQPIYSLVGTAGQTYWGIFARARNSENPPPSVPDLMLQFGLLSGVLAAVMVTAMIFFTGPITNGELKFSLAYALAFTFLLVTLAISYPIGMKLTTPGGLRFQARLTLLMVIVNLVTSVVLTMRLGGVGPVLASAMASLLCMTVPSAVKLRSIS